MSSDIDNINTHIAENYVTPIIVPKWMSESETLGVNVLVFKHGIKKYVEETFGKSIEFYTIPYRNISQVKFDIAKSLKNDIPVVLLIGDKGNVNFYDYGTQKLFVNIPEVGHYVTVTEISVDETSGNTILTIATWGRKKQMILEEYVERDHGTFGEIFSYKYKEEEWAEKQERF